MYQGGGGLGRKQGALLAWGIVCQGREEEETSLALAAMSRQNGVILPENPVLRPGCLPGASGLGTVPEPN